MKIFGITTFLFIFWAIEAQSLTCPEDSIATEDGCKCVSPCPPVKCLEGQRPEVRSAAEETPGSCCPLYHCVPQTPISWAAKDEGEFKGCIDESGSPRAIGEQWNQEPCTNCTCEESNGIGTRSCHTTMCKSCEGSSQLITGECCPRCLDSNNETETFTTIANMPTENCDSLVNCEPPCHLGTLDDLDSCPSCECPNDAESTMNSTNKMCPKLVHCGLDCKLERDQGDCPVCACQSNPEHNVTVIPVNGPGTSDEQEERSVICPELKCDLHCDHGFVMDENDCTLCECKPQALDCPPLGCKKKCPYGYKHNRRGCPTCRCHATCVDHRNITHPEGSSWNPDACTSCKCDALGRLVCRETVCSVACSNPLPPKQGTCCPVCPINETDNSKNENHQSNRSGWGIVPITLIVVLTLLCLILMIFLARGRFRGRLSPSSNLYTSYPAQYYKCVPAYETPVHQNEKIVPL